MPSATRMVSGTMLTGLASILIAGLVVTTRPSAAGRDEPATDPGLAHLSGRELVRRLHSEDTRLGAFRELSRRKGRDRIENLRRPELTVCPQGPGREPLYLVLSEFLEDFRDTGAFDSAGLDDLFPKDEAVPAGPLALRNHLLIEVITAEGEMIAPFGGNNVLNDGVVRDLNGDGAIDRLDHTPYSVDGLEDVEVLHVWPVTPDSQPSFNVLYNWGNDEWGYQLADRDQDGRAEIELGPRQAEGILPKVVFAWDAEQGSYRSTSGTEGAHFRVLASGQPWKEFERLKAAGLAFPADPEAVPADERAGALGFRQPDTQITPHSEPYAYRSLRDLDDDAILRYMGEGARVERGYSQGLRTPPELWTAPAKAASVAFVEANRSPEHRLNFHVALADRDGVAPPDAGAVALHGASAPCYEASDWVWYLSARPGDSFLAYGSSTRAGTVFFNFVTTQASFAVGYAPVSYDDARRVLQAAWWLSRVRTKARREINFGTMGSTGDGRGRLVVRSTDGSALAEAQDTLWGGGCCANRWTGEYDAEVFLNLAADLVQTALPKRLGPLWPPPVQQCSFGRCPPTKGLVAARARERTRLDADQILHRFAPDGSAIPAALASMAVGAIAEQQLESTTGRFEGLLAQLPARDPRVRDVKTVRAELEHLNPVGKEDIEPDAFQAAFDRVQTVMDELDRVRYGFDEAAGREVLRAELKIALRQIRTRDDRSALEAWAKTEDPGWRFALARLRDVDSAAYTRALEHWLARATDESRRQVFGALAEANPARARELAAAAGPSSDLAVASFGMLARAETIPDQAERIRALVRLLDDTSADWQERVRAIEVLVPSEEPLRLPTSSIDDALLKRLTPLPSDENGPYIAGPAARALAERGRVAAFRPLLKAWEKSERQEIAALSAGEIMGALAHLAQQAGPDERHRLAGAFRSRLQATNGFVSESVLAIWAADLRELRPDLERVATSSPDDVEGEQASSWQSGAPRAVEDRFHQARRVAALWNEEDAFTRARLLLAFGRYEPTLASPERAARMKSALKDAAAALGPADRARLRGFLETIEANAPAQPEWAEHTQELTALAREAFGWPPGRPPVAGLVP